MKDRRPKLRKFAEVLRHLAFRADRKSKGRILLRASIYFLILLSLHFLPLNAEAGGLSGGCVGGECPTTGSTFVDPSDGKTYMLGPEQVTEDGLILPGTGKWIPVENPTTPNKDANANGQQPNGQQPGATTPAAPPPPPPCVGETQQAAQSCQASMNRAKSSCAGSNMDNYTRQAQQTGSEIESGENANGACVRAENFQKRYSQALRDYQSSCSSSVNQCQSTCEQAQAKANSCSDSRARQYVSTIQSGSSECTSGETASRPRQIQAEVGNAQAQSNDAGACNKTTAASTGQNNDNGTNKQEAGRTPSGTPGSEVGSNGGSGESTTVARGKNPLNANGVDPESGNKDGTDGDVDGNGTARSATNDYSTGSGVYANSSLAALPGRKPTEDGATSNEEKVKASNPLDGTMAGGRRGPRRAYKGIDLDSLTPAEQALAAKESIVGIPDLNQFRPKGMMGASSAEKFDGHGPHVDIWTKMHERYRMLGTTFFDESH